MAVIASEKSVISAIFDNSESITKKMANALDRINMLLNDKNMQNISNITDKLSSSITYMDKNRKKFIQTLENISLIREDIRKNLDKITIEVKKFNDKTAGFYTHTVSFEDKLLPSFEKLGQMSDKAAVASKKTEEFFQTLQQKAKRGEFDISEIVENNMDILNETSLAIKDLSQKIENLVQSIQESPSDIIYKSRDKMLGPGEKK